jgi:hypothetical protein
MTDKSLKSLGTWKLVVLFGILAISNLGPGYEKDKQPDCERCWLSFGGPYSITFEPFSLHMYGGETKSVTAKLAEAADPATWSLLMSEEDLGDLESVTLFGEPVGKSVVVEIASVDNIPSGNLMDDHGAGKTSVGVRAVTADPSKFFQLKESYFPVFTYPAHLSAPVHVKVRAGGTVQFVAKVIHVNPDQEWEFEEPRMTVLGKEFKRGEALVLPSGKQSADCDVWIDEEYFQDYETSDMLFLRITAKTRTKPTWYVSKLVHVWVLPASSESQ